MENVNTTILQISSPTLNLNDSESKGPTPLTYPSNITEKSIPRSVQLNIYCARIGK